MLFNLAIFLIWFLFLLYGMAIDLDSFINDKLLGVWRVELSGIVSATIFIKRTRQVTCWSSFTYYFSMHVVYITLWIYACIGILLYYAMLLSYLLVNEDRGSCSFAMLCRRGWFLYTLSLCEDYIYNKLSSN